MMVHCLSQTAPEGEPAEARRVSTKEWRAKGLYLTWAQLSCMGVVAHEDRESLAQRRIPWVSVVN